MGNEDGNVTMEDGLGFIEGGQFDSVSSGQLREIGVSHLTVAMDASGGHIGVVQVIR